MGQLSAFGSGMAWFTIVWFALLVLAGASMVIRSVWAPMHARRGAACGACGYELARIDAPCPECGANLIRAGVLTPVALVRNRGGMFQITVGWLLVIGGIATPIYSFVASALAQSQRQALMVGMTSSNNKISSFVIRPDAQSATQFFGMPQSGPFDMALVVDQIDPERDGSIRFDLERVGDAEHGTTLATAGEAWDLTSEWGDPINLGADLNDDLATEFFEDAGYDPSNPQIAAAIRELPELGRKLRADPHHQIGMRPGAALAGQGSWSDGRTFRTRLGAGMNPFGGQPSSRPERPERPESKEWRIETNIDIEYNEWDRPESGTIELALLTEDDRAAIAEINVETGAVTIESKGNADVSAGAFTVRESVTLFDHAGVERYARNASNAIKTLPDLVARLLEGTTDIWSHSGSGSGYTIDNMQHASPGFMAPGTTAAGTRDPLVYAKWGTIAGSIVCYLIGLAVLVRLRFNLFRGLRTPAAG